MRLIDADALMVWLVNMLNEFDDGNDPHEIKREMFQVVLAKTRKMPTVDAVPVVHGRWIPKVIHMNTPDYYACSVCEHEVDEDFTSAIPVPYVYKFCPNCGAKMDGGGDDADG